jgi:tetratricopeptide (TPR) repeat protein
MNQQHIRREADILQFNEYHREGCAAYNAREWKLATQLLKQALEGREGLLGINADDTAETRRYYAEALYMARNYESARVQFTSLVFWAEKKLGPDHIQTLQNRNSLGDTLEKCRHFSAAREQFKQAALGFEMASGGTANIDSLLCRYKLGVLASAGEAYDPAWPHWAEAEESLQRAAQGLSTLLGARDERAFQARKAYAKALLKMRKDSVALAQFKSVLSIAEARGMAKNDDTVQEIKRCIKECQFWLCHIHAQSPKRLVIARERAAQSEQRQINRIRTYHWNA